MCNIGGMKNARRRKPAAGFRQQLSEAFDASGLTLLDLIRRSGLECSVSTMSRKLNGEQTLRDTEIEALARALCVEVVAGPKRGAA